MTETPPSSPSRRVHEPISLQKLLSQLSNRQIICVNSPFPYMRNCKRPVVLKDQEQKLSKACDLIQVFINVSHAHRWNFFHRLKELAETFSCDKHMNYGEEFAYHWLAEALLPNILEYMGWQKDAFTWTCLGSKKDRTCLPLNSVRQKNNHHRIYSSLNRLATGGDRIAGAFQYLMKHLLCGDHTAAAEGLTQQLSDKLLRYTSGKDPLKIRHVSPAGPEKAFEQTPREKTDNESTSGYQFDGNNGLSGIVRLRGDLSGSLTDSKRQSQGIQAEASPIAKSSSEEPTAPAGDQSSQGDDFGNILGSSSIRNQGVDATLSPNTLASGTGSDSSQTIPNPETPQNYRNAPYLSPSPRAGRGRRRGSASIYGCSALYQNVTPDGTDLPNDSELPTHTSPSTADTTTPSTAKSVSPSSESRKRTVSQDSTTGDASTAPAKKPRRRSALRTSSSTIFGERTQEAQHMLKFKPFHPKEESITKIVKNIIHEIKKYTSSAKPGHSSEGYVYIFGIVGRPGFVKIGETAGSVKKRQKQVQRCTKSDLEILGIQWTTQISFSKRVERLVHMDLHNKRRYFECNNCKAKARGDSSDACDGFTNHGEWFEISEIEAENTVKRWKDWMQSTPCYADGRLKEKWKRIIKNCEGNAKYFETTIANEELTGKRWNSFMDGSYDYWWLRWELWDSWTGKPSRWMFCFCHFAISFSMNYFAGCYAGIMSMILCSLFALLSISYAP